MTPTTYKPKTYYYIYGRSGNLLADARSIKLHIQTFTFNPMLLTEQKIESGTYKLTKEELDFMGWKESDFDHIIDLVHKDMDEWEKGQIQLLEKLELQGETK